MAVTQIPHYTLAADLNGNTWSVGPSLLSTYTPTSHGVVYEGTGSTPVSWVGYITVGTRTLATQLFTYPIPPTVSAGSGLYDVDWGNLRFTLRSTVYWPEGTPTYTDTGNRVITAACTAGGTVTSSVFSPLTGADNPTATTTAVTRPTADIAEALGFLTVTATPAASTGTLISRGYTAGTLANWTWPDAVLWSAQQTSSGVATDSSITFSLRAGRNDATFTANFTRSLNSASTWSPASSNVVIHLLDTSLVETETSLNSVGNSTAWSTFRAKGFTTLQCAAGGNTRDWYPTSNGYTSGAYLLNVSSAVFSVTPIAGMRVYAWTVEKADGTFVPFGSSTSAALSGFEEGCKVHLYLTSATPNPRIVYDGFDTAGVVPADQSVVVAGGVYPVGSSWVSSGESSAVAVSFSPTAWAARTVGQQRSVIIDGAETVLTNVAGTGASVTSAAAAYSVNHVKFKQTTLATDGVLTVTLVVDTITTIAVAVNVSQGALALAALTASGTANYYKGSDLLMVSTAITNYGGASPANFILRMVPDVVHDADVIGTASSTLDASTTPRTITVYVTQVVTVGSLSAVAINLSRDVSVGSMIATSAGPITQCSAGSISVTMTTGQSSALPIYIECAATSGYTLKSIRVQSSDGTATYYAGPAPSTATAIYPTIPRAMDGENIKVVLVLAAVIVSTPTILPLLPDDLGKFAASVVSTGGYGDFRVGDSVTLSAAPISIDATPMTGVAIGTPVFNGSQISPVRSTTSITAVATLALGDNVFKIPVYSLFEASSTPSGAGASVTTEWDVDDTLTISAEVYRRIGSIFTVTAPLTSTGYTVISGKVNRRAVASGFGYIEAEVLQPVVASATTRTFSSTLRGPTQCVAVYAKGVQHPSFVFAAYDYNAGAYITQGVRPTITTTAVSPAALEDNFIATISWPTPNPGSTYRAAAFLARKVTSEAFLPQVSIKIASGVSTVLEVWNPTTTTWIPYSSTTATLDTEFTFFRVSVGDAPSDLVTATFQTAVRLVDGTPTDVPGCVVYATSGAVYDGNFALPATMQARSRSVLHARATPPYGYTVSGWYIDSVLVDGGASISVIVPDTGLSLKPLLTVREIAATSVMVLNADPNKTDEGVWVSKLFRAQFPWKPLTAHVIAHPETSPVALAVMKDGSNTPPTGINTDNPGTVAITVTGNAMRRLPPGQIQKTRFVRYMVVVSGESSVSSVAVGSGAETMKGGH